MTVSVRLASPATSLFRSFPRLACWRPVFLKTWRWAVPLGIVSDHSFTLRYIHSPKFAGWKSSWTCWAAAVWLRATWNERSWIGYAQIRKDYLFLVLQVHRIAFPANECFFKRHVCYMQEEPFTLSNECRVLTAVAGFTWYPTPSYSIPNFTRLQRFTSPIPTYIALQVNPLQTNLSNVERMQI